jgi:hypothetical protein
MAKDSKGKDGSPIDSSIAMDEPTVELGNDSQVRERLRIHLDPIDYRAKTVLLGQYGGKLRDAEVAYLDDKVFRIEDCIDYFYTLDPAIEDGLKKAIGAANASGKACVLLMDDRKDIIACSLSEPLNYREVRTPDHMGTAYGGLTYLETRGRRYVSNLTILLIVTQDFYFLVPTASDIGLREDLGYYRRLVEYCKYGLEPIAFLAYAAKSSKLEKYMTGSK